MVKMQDVPNMNTFAKKWWLNVIQKKNLFTLFALLITYPQITNSVKKTFFEHLGISSKFVGVINVHLYDELNSKPPIFHFD